MLKYPKIQTVYRRDPETKYKTLLEGQYARPEFEYLANNEWVWTEKIDGTSIRVKWRGQDDWTPLVVSFHGRTDKAQMPPFLLAKLQEMFPIERLIELYPVTTMTLYGEGYGARIQKGGGNYIPDGVSFILFDVLIDSIWLSRENVEDIAGKLSIDVVPIVGRGTLLDAVGWAREGIRSRIGDRYAEGLVMRPAVELLNRKGGRIIAKIKYKDFNHQGRPRE